MNTTVDGDYQTYKAESGAFVREHFFGRDPRTAAMVEHLSDDDLKRLRRGGHDVPQGLRGLCDGGRDEGRTHGHPG